METPSSVRRASRFQDSAASQKMKQEDALSISRSDKKSDRPVALLDITNDSPIVGLAAASLVEKTPSSVAKNRAPRAKQTPGSGEALLRGQVKNLLQKVEEGAELVNKLPSGDRPQVRVTLGAPVYPVKDVAPMPSNVPKIPILCDFKEDVVPDVVMRTGTEEDGLKISTKVGECLINRALLFDSPGKSEMSDSSMISSQGRGSVNSEEKSSEDEISSAWSLEVNASIQESEEGIEDIEEEADVYCVGEDGDQDGEEDTRECYEDLCEVLMKMSVQDKVGLPEFEGKHTRFVYNSDGEIEREEGVGGNAVSPSVLVLKGLPIPEGKHLRFQEEEE